MSRQELRFAVVGHPVSHSASPAMHTAAFRALGLPHRYEAIDCLGHEALARVVELLRVGHFTGINVTAPFKQSALSLADLPDELAHLTGAANTLVRHADGTIEAHNTDVGGVIDELGQLQPPSGQGVALILGSGGAARAAFVACKRLGIRVIGVTSRSWVNTEALMELTSARFFREQGALTLPWPLAGQAASRGSEALLLQWFDLASTADLLIQATSAGLAGGPPGQDVAAAIPWNEIPPNAAAFDLVYGPLPTPFEQQAARRGLRQASGIGLLARQGARSLSLWLGQPAPLEVMIDAARRHVTSLF
jgi:shikimate dehydrogenase